MERDLIRQYERDLSQILPQLSEETRDIIIALAELPLTIQALVQ